MSINHLISPLQDPKLDLYIRNLDASAVQVEGDIECKNLNVAEKITATDIECDDIETSTLTATISADVGILTMDTQVNPNDVVQFYGTGISASLPTNPFLKDITGNANLTNFSPINVVIQTRLVALGNYSTTYYINFSAQGEFGTSDEGSFDFKGLNAFDLLTIPSYSSQNTTGEVIGATSIGRSTFAVPDDPVNDYKINFEFPTASGGERDIFNFTIITSKYL